MSYLFAADNIIYIMMTKQAKTKPVRPHWWITAFIAMFIFILFTPAITLYQNTLSADTALAPLIFKSPNSPLLWRDILILGIPGFTVDNAPNHSSFTFHSILSDIIISLTNVDINDIGSLFRVEIPLATVLRISAKSHPVDFPNFAILPQIHTPEKGALVAIYHTHTSESFIPDSGVDHAPGGQRGDIVSVGEAMVKRFAQHDILAIQSKDIHDYPIFMKAYDKSEITLSNLIKENPSLQAAFDIHRDSGTREESTATVNGQTVARILIVVGRGQPGLEEPHWNQNYEFAKAIDAKLNQRYPGVSRGIELVEWRYNQHLHPHALLFEMGSEHSTKEEAIRTIEIMADIISEILLNSG